MKKPRVTAFITTIGAQTFPRCLEAARAMPGVKVEVIANVTPYSAAMQRMVDACDTEFFLQVDEDMILVPHAARRLVELMDASPPDTVMGVGPLFDEEVKRQIYGIKIWRTALVRTVPYGRHVTSDTYHRQQLRAKGYGFVKLKRGDENCLGLHGTDYTAEQRFKRWRRLWQKSRHGAQKLWIVEELPNLLEKFRETGSRSDLFALVGAVMGATEPLWPADHDPYDANHPDPVLEELCKLFPST